MKVDKVIDEITQLLYREKAFKWPVRDKGALLAAVKLSLQKQQAGGQDSD